MTEPAAFRATYSDWKLIRTRKCVQLVFEVPIEESNKAYEVLGGMPNPASEIWCAVARLVNSAEEKPAHKPPPSAIPDKAGAARNKLAQRAALLCKDPVFHRFLEETQFCSIPVTEVEATGWLRTYCNVKSRSEIIWGSAAGNKWEDLFSQFIVWRDGPHFAETAK